MCSMFQSVNESKYHCDRYIVYPSALQSVDNAEATEMPQKVTRIVTRFFERCYLFHVKTDDIQPGLNHTFIVVS